MLRKQEANCLLSNGHDVPYSDNLCLFRAISIHLFGSVGVEPHVVQLFDNFVSATNCEPENFMGVSLDQIPIIENLVEKNIFIYDFAFEDGEIVVELIRLSIERTLYYFAINNHICYVNDVNKFFKKFRCPSCDVFFNHSGHFNRHLRTCKERVKNVYPRGVYSLKETFFQKLENFSIAYPEDCTLFKNFSAFDSQAICDNSSEISSTAITS